MLVADGARLRLPWTWTLNSPVASATLQHAAALVPTLLAIFTAAILLGRAIVATNRDPSQCFSLIRDGGFWLDPSPSTISEGYYNRWQPQSCILHNYTWHDIETCMPKGKIAYAGDSTVIAPYMHLVNWYTNHWDLFHDRLGDLAFTHQSLAFPLGEMEARVYWDPYLYINITEYWKTRMSDEIPDKYNSSARHELAALQGSPLSEVSPAPAFMFIGTGLWELQEQEGDLAKSIDEWDWFLSPWLDRLDILDENSDVRKNPSLQPRPPGLFLINPIQEPDPTKIGKYKDWLSVDATRKLNQWLKKRTISSGGIVVFSFNAMTPYKAAMFDTSGHHARVEVNRGKNNLLMNWRCNQILSDMGVLPFTSNGLCCINPPVGPRLQWFLMLIIATLAAGVMLYAVSSSTEKAETTEPASQSGVNLSSTNLLRRFSERIKFPVVRELIDSNPWVWNLLPYLVVILLNLLADRTFFLATHQKYFSFRLYLLYNVLVVLATLFTQSRIDEATEDPGFFKALFSRAHTDEWKGWMTLAACGIDYFSPLPSYSLQAYYNFQAAAYVFMFALANTNYLLTTQRPRPLVYRILRLNLLPCSLALFLPGIGSNAVLCFSFVLTLGLILFEVLLYIHRTKGSSLVYASIPPVVCLVSILLLHHFTPLFDVLLHPIKQSILVVFPSFDFAETFTCSAIFFYLGHLAGFLVRPSSSLVSNQPFRLSLFHSMDKYRAGALGFSGLFVLFTMFIMPAHMSLRRTWIPGFSNLDIPTVHPTILTISLPFIAVIAYPAIRATKPLRNLYSPVMSSIGGLSLEIWALRQHLWLGADGSAITRIALIDTWLPAGPHSRRVVFFMRALDMVLLGALVIALARYIRAVDLSALAELLATASNWLLDRQVGGKSLREIFGRKTEGDEIEVTTLLANGNGHKHDDDDV